MNTRVDAKFLLAFLVTVAIVTGCTKTEPAVEPEQTASEAGNTSASDHAATQPQLDELHPEVVLETSHGPITLRLDAEKAPLTVRNFLTYVQSGFYDQTIFHQVDSGHIILGGGRTEDLREKPVLMPVLNESNNGLKNRRGTIAMFRDAANVDSAGAEFFINLSDNAHLDHRAPTDKTTEGQPVTPTAPEDYGYCVFGEVVEGMEAIDKIASSPVHDVGEFRSVPVTPIAIQKVRRVR